MQGKCAAAEEGETRILHEAGHELAVLKQPLLKHFHLRTKHFSEREMCIDHIHWASVPWAHRREELVKKELHSNADTHMARLQMFYFNGLLEGDGVKLSLWAIDHPSCFHVNKSYCSF